MHKLGKVILMSPLFLLIFSKPAFAVEFTFSGAPSSIKANDTFIVDVNLKVSNSSGNSYYILGMFSNSNTPTSYFGYTKNNQEDWYNGSDKTRYLKITMDQDGQWSGPIEVKLDTSDSGYKGGGTYNFKLGRYTLGGSNSTNCDKESTPCTTAIISVLAPTPTPTSQPTPTPTKVPTPTKAPSPTKSPTPVKSSSSSSSPITSTHLSPVTPTTKPNTQATNTISSVDSIANLSGIPTSVMGMSTVSAAKKSQNPKPNPKKVLVNAATQTNPIPFVIGALFFVGSGIYTAYRIKKSKNRI